MAEMTVETDAGKHYLAVMGREGDMKTMWSKNNPDEVRHARDTFKDLISKGFTAFRVDADGEKAGQMREFDPEAEKVILVPAIAGG